MSAENPGSFADWTQRNTGISKEEAIQKYDQELSSYRHRLAEEKGVTEEALHEVRPADYVSHVGELALDYEIQQSERV